MQTTTNLFAKLEKKQPAAAKKTDKKIFKAPELECKISRFITLKNEIDAATSELKMIEGDIKEKGKAMYMEQYKAEQAKPDNFKIQDQEGQSCMIIVMDKYTSVDECKAEVLKQYGLLNEEVTYKFNAELVAKYGEILSSLIVNCPDIEDEDKGNLISGEISYSVKKGAIDKLMQYNNPENIFELINPIISLKK